MALIAELNALTQELYLPRITMNFGSEVPLLKLLLAKGQKLQGGTSIRKSIAYQYTKGGAYGRGQVFDLSGEENFTAADWSYRYYMWPVSLTRQDQLENAGPSQVHDIMEAKVEVLRRGATEDLAGDLFAVGAAGGNDSSLTINSLDHALDDGSTLSTNATYGGISKTTYTWWAGNVFNAQGNGHGPAYANLKNAIAMAHDASIMPNMLMAAPETVDTFILSQQSNQRYVNEPSGELAKMMVGFTLASFDGKPFVGDKHIVASATETSNRVYFLDTDYFSLVTHEKENFRLDGWKEPIDQASMVNKLFWAGNVITWDPSRHAVMYNFDYNVTAA